MFVMHVHSVHIENAKNWQGNKNDMKGRGEIDEVKEL